MPGGVPTPKQIKDSAPTRNTSIYSGVHSSQPNAPKGSLDNPIKAPEESPDYAKISAAEEQFAADHP